MVHEERKSTAKVKINMDFIEFKKSAYHVGSLERGLTVLEYIATVRRPVRLGEIVDNLGINYTSATRMCSTLCALGFMRKDSMKQYHLTAKVLALGYAALQGLKWNKIVEMILIRLHDDVMQTVNMGILSGNSVLYLCRLRKDKYLPYDLQVGMRLPLHCTALGKALLAFSHPDLIANIIDKLELKAAGPMSITKVNELNQQIKVIKRRGYSINDEELTPNVLAVGCPVLDSQGFALMAINVTVKKSEFTMERLLKNITPKLVSTAEEIAKTLNDMKIKFEDICETDRIFL
jgi:DNA-binding IclR family transcriptional regulator